MRTLADSIFHHEDNVVLQSEQKIQYTSNIFFTQIAMFFAVILPHVYVVAAVVIASLFPLTYRSWHSELHHLMQKLSDEGHESPRDEDDNCITLSTLKQRIGELPKVVKQWMESALCLSSKTRDSVKTIPFVRTLRIEQEGQFFLNERWVPFTATQEFSARQTHPGFVWDAKVEAFGGCNGIGIPILILDAYIHGIGGIMKARLPLGIPIVSMKDTDDLNLGELHNLFHLNLDYYERMKLTQNELHIMKAR